MTSGRERIGRLDVAIAIVIAALGVLLMYGNVQDDNASWLAIPGFLLVTTPILWRSVAPVAALGATLAALLLHYAAFGTDVVRCGVVLPIVFLLAFSTAARFDLREAKIGLWLALAIIVAESAVFFGPFGVVFAALTTVVWYTGRVARSRARLASELHARTAELREARDERARLEVAGERGRLSGELDRLLQRRLGDLARLAGEDGRPSEAAAATATLVEIERESRETLEQMRAVVGLLREDEGDAETGPQPTLTQLDALLVRAKGTRARLSVEGRPRVLPPGVELSAYRIVEHLLAALEDAPGVDVRVRFGDGALELAVAGPARRRARAEIDRARERVELHRGTLEATSRGGRAEVVASLPLLAGA